MNVSAGDMAIVVRAPDALEWALGRVVEVDHRCTRCAIAQELAIWCLRETVYGPRGQTLMCCEDYCLKRLPPLADSIADWQRLGDVETLA